MPTPAALPWPTLQAGHPRRPTAGRAIIGTLCFSILFTAATWCVKEIPAIDVHMPWQDDPYDVVVSFALLFTPLLIGLTVVRLPLCRATDPLPLGRVDALLRAARVLIAVSGATLASDWVAVASGADRSAWTSITAAAVAGLAATSAAWLVSARFVHRAGRLRNPNGSTVAGPDWLEDGLLMLVRAVAAVGARRSTGDALARWADSAIAVRIRRHPVTTAAWVSAAVGAGVALSAAFDDGVGAVSLLFFAVATCGVFSFVTLAGGALRLVQPAARLSGRRRRLLDATIAACAAVPSAVAFRNAVWQVAGMPHASLDLRALTVVIMCSAAIVFLGVLAGESLVKIHG